MSHGPRNHLDDAPPARVDGGFDDGTADGTTNGGGDGTAEGSRDDDGGA